MTFKERFSQKHGCSLANFDRLVFWHSLKPAARPFCMALFWACPGYFWVDMQTIRLLGDAKSTTECEAILQKYRQLILPRPGRGESRRLFRISSTRLARLCDQVMAPEILPARPQLMPPACVAPAISMQ